MASASSPHHRYAALAALGMAVVACHSGLPGPASVSGVQQTGAIQVAIHPGFGTTSAPLPKRAADITTFTVTLYDNTNTQVAAAGSLVNPLTITSPAVTGSFSGIPNGNGYYVKVDALDAGNASLSQGGAQASTNTVNIVSGSPVYSAGTALTVNLTLRSNTGTLSKSAAITYGPTETDPPPVPGGDTYTVSLFNWATREITPGPLATDPRFHFNQVRASSLWNGMGPYTVVPTVVNNTTKQASVPYHEGSYDFTTSGNVNQRSTFIYRNIATGAGSVTIQKGPVAQWINGTVYFDGTNIRHQRVDIAGANVVIAATPGAVKGLVCDYNTSDLYYTTGTNVIRATQASNYATVTTALTATNLGALTADLDTNLFWQETGTNKLYKATLSGGVYGTPQLLATLANPVLSLATDFAGSLYYATGPAIGKIPMQHNGTFGAPVTVVTAPSAVTSFTVDWVGDVIFTDGTNYLKMVLGGRTPATIYTLAGTGNTLGGGVTNFPANASPYTENGLAEPGYVMYDGNALSFTSLGNAGVGRYWHVIQPQ